MQVFLREKNLNSPVVKLGMTHNIKFYEAQSSVNNILSVPLIMIAL